MTMVRLQENEPFEVSLKRFKRKCVRDGIFSEVRKRRYHEKPSVRKRKKAESARRLAMKRRVF